MNKIFLSFALVLGMATPALADTCFFPYYGYNNCSWVPPSYPVSVPIRVNSPVPQYQYNGGYPPSQYPTVYTNGPGGYYGGGYGYGYGYGNGVASYPPNYGRNGFLNSVGATNSIIATAATATAGILSVVNQRATEKQALNNAAPQQVAQVQQPNQQQNVNIDYHGKTVIAVAQEVIYHNNQQLGVFTDNIPLLDNSTGTLFVYATNAWYVQDGRYPNYMTNIVNEMKIGWITQLGQGKYLPPSITGISVVVDNKVVRHYGL